MLKHQLAVFLVVGISIVVIDFLIYSVLIYIDQDNLLIVKGLGFVGGTIFAYFANRFLTFRNQKTCSGSVSRFILVYIIGLSANVYVNHLCIYLLNTFLVLIDSQKTIYIAFFLATTISATLNFLGMKFFVFTGSPMRNV